MEKEYFPGLMVVDMKVIIHRIREMEKELTTGWIIWNNEIYSKLVKDKKLINFNRSDGKKFKGDWTYGKQNGRGTIEYSDERVEEGEWRFGKKIWSELRKYYIKCLFKTKLTNKNCFALTRIYLIFL